MLPLAALCAVLAQAAAPRPAAEPSLQSELAPTFHGRVVAQESGAAIAGARIELRWNRGRAFRSRSHGEPKHEIVEPPPFPSATSALDGWFTLEYETKFDPWVVVTAPGRGPVACGLLAGHDDPARALVFDLPRAARLEIEQPVDAEGRDPWAGLEAGVVAPLWASSRPAWLAVFADDVRLSFRRSAEERGNVFVLDGLPPGAPLEIAFTRDGTAAGELAEELVLDPGETRRITWTPPPKAVAPAQLRVVVRDPLGAALSGTPVVFERMPDERIALSGSARASRKLTADDGSFTWSDVRPGWYVVALGEDRGASRFAPPASARIDDGAGVVTVELVARAGRRVRGRVVDAHGKGVEGARVAYSARAGQTKWSVETRTVEDGRFELGPVPKEGTGSVQADHPTVPDLVATVAEKSGQELDELRFAAPARVLVSVLDAQGAPCPAQIRADDPSVLGALWRGYAESEVVLERRAGPLVVSAFTADGRAAWASVDARAGEPTAIELVLEKAGQVRLRHRGSPRLLDVKLVGAGERVLGITTVIAGVDDVVLAPPGSWTVRTKDGSREIRAEAGVELLVDL